MGANESTASDMPSLGLCGEVGCESFAFVHEADLLPTRKIDLSCLTLAEVEAIKHVLRKQLALEWKEAQTLRSVQPC